MVFYRLYYAPCSATVHVLLSGNDVPAYGSRVSYSICVHVYFLSSLLLIFICCTKYGWWSVVVDLIMEVGIWPGVRHWSLLYLFDVCLIIFWHSCHYGCDAGCPSNRRAMPNFLQN